MSDERPTLTNDRVRVLRDTHIGCEDHTAHDVQQIARELIERRAQVAELEERLIYTPVINAETPTETLMLAGLPLDEIVERLKNDTKMAENFARGVGKENARLHTRVAELEAENARLRVHNVRVVNGAIVGLDEIMGEG